MSEISKKHILNTFGVSKTFSERVQKKLGLNLRTSFSFFKRIHHEKLQNLYNKIKTGKTLRQDIKNCVRFNNNIKRYKKLTNDSKKKPNQVSKKNF